MKRNEPKPLNSFSKVDQVEIRLREYFKSENLRPGDLIPFEAELAKSMSVSRTVLREALARLKVLGLIESKRNRGIILTEPDILGSIERVLEPSFLDADTLQDVFELRLVLELGISELLFLRKNLDQLDQLEKIVEKEEATEDRFVKNRCDADFHATLYQMSGNRTILRFQRMLRPIFNHVYNSSIVRQNKAITPVTHRELLETLRHGIPAEFQEQMKAHLQVYFNTIEG